MKCIDNRHLGLTREDIATHVAAFFQYKTAPGFKVPLGKVWDHLHLLYVAVDFYLTAYAESTYVKHAFHRVSFIIPMQEMVRLQNI